MVRGGAPIQGASRGASSAASREDSSTTPAPTSSSTPGTSTRGGLRGGTASRATRGPTVGRFRPKVVRRDEAEREAIARHEEQKANARLAEEQRARGRSRFRSKRSRGDAMGARGGRIMGGASGPFSGGSGGFMSGGRGFGGGGGGFGGGGGGGGGFGGSRGPKREGEGFNEMSSNRNRETRINADKLHAMAPEDELNSDDEAMMAALSGSSTAALPMGIYRQKHKKAEVVVATTAELEAAENATGEEESLFLDGGDANRPSEQPPEEGVWDTGKGKAVQIKPDPDSKDATPMDVDSIEEAEKKAQILKAKKAALIDPEDKLMQADLQLLANELGNVTIVQENEDGEKSAVQGPSNKDGRLYLFQFPPMLPPLQQFDAPPPKSKVKAEPEDSNMLDSTPNAETNPVDLTAEKEDGENKKGDKKSDEDDSELAKGFMSSLLKEGGMIGKLNVRRSGKVELDWGGKTLELGPAAGMNFLTTAVILEENDTKPGPAVIGGEGVGMGKIMGRFVLAPTWKEEDDWDVAEEELEWERGGSLA